MGCILRYLLASAIGISLVLYADGGATANTNPPDRNEEEGGKYVVTTDSVKQKGKCIQVIKIGGKGVEDRFRGPCVDDLEIVNSKDVLVIGDPDKNPFALFSDKARTLVIVKDGQCTKRSYTTVKGKTTSSSSDLDDDECEKLEEKMKQELAKKRESEKGDKKGRSKYVVTTDTSERKGKCIKEIKIEGNGVEDSIRGPCVDNLEVVNTNDVLIIGDPEKDPLSLFSDKASTLVIVKDGQCTKRSYTTVKGKTTSSSSDLDDDECEKLEEKIKQELEKKKEMEKGDKQGRSKYVVTTDTSERTGKCIHEIKIVGNGVEDSFSGPCVDNLKVINRNDVLIIGDPEKNPFSLFSDKANTLVIVKDGQCTKRSYTTVNGKTTSSSPGMDGGECEKVEKKIKQELDIKKENPEEGEKSGLSKYVISSDTFEMEGKCIQEIKIEGNGVEDNVREPCVDSELEVANSNGVMIIGDPEKDPFALFSDKASTLVIVKDDKCTERSYTTVNGKTTSSSSNLDDGQCDKVKEKIKQELVKKRKAEKGSSPYHVSTETSVNNEKCIQEFKIKGNGVEDIFKGPCVENLEVVNSKDVLIVGDPKKDRFSLFSDKANSLVIFTNGTCKKRSYIFVKGKTTQSQTELYGEECKLVLRKIEKELKKSRDQSKDSALTRF